MSPLSPMSSMSPARSRVLPARPAGPGPQFESTGRPPSNLDRCNICGTPRSGHGADWSCPSFRQASRPRVLALAIVAAALALAGIAVLTATSATATTVGTLGASAVLAGLTVLICLAVILSRER